MGLTVEVDGVPAGMTIRLTGACEAAAVMEVLDGGRAAIAQLGLEQWQHGYPNLDSVTADITAGRCLVAEDTASGALLGTCALCLERDADYTAAAQAGVPWLTDSFVDPVPYAAVHRCATAAAARRRGVMAALIADVSARALAAGRVSLHMDTHPDNVRMRGFLASQGFTELGAFEMVDHAVPTDTLRIAYEKMLV